MMRTTKAQQARTLIKADYDKVFEDFDVIIDQQLQHQHSRLVKMLMIQ